MQEGIITKQISNDYTVDVDGGKKIICKARGKFRKMHITPLVGDRVMVDYKNHYIVDIMPRKNELIRPSVANIDQAIIVTSTYIPNFSSNLLDKLLVNIEYNNVLPIICFTKLDLIDKETYQEINQYIAYYRKIGYQVYLNTDKELSQIFKNKISVLAGQSGAGKSTLLNNLDHRLNIATGEVSLALGRGKHTTRHVELIALLDGLVADTPGFSSLAFDGMSAADIRDNFIEFNQYRSLCEYQDCMHLNEENCEVKRRVKSGDILSSRYENYCKFVAAKNDEKKYF